MLCLLVTDSGVDEESSQLRHYCRNVTGQEKASVRFRRRNDACAYLLAYNDLAK